jgi:hypothetical protein
MITKKLTIENPKQVTGYGAEKLEVAASLAIEMQCSSPADQVRALFALDAIWREAFAKLDALTHNDPLPASESSQEDLQDMLA